MKTFVYQVALAAFSATTLIEPVTALTAGPHDQVLERDTSANPQHGILNKIMNFFNRGAPAEANQLIARQDDLCVFDDYYTFVSNKPSPSAFCNSYISIPLATVTADYTPTS